MCAWNSWSHCIVQIGISSFESKTTPFRALVNPSRKGQSEASFCFRECAHTLSRDSGHSAEGIGTQAAEQEGRLLQLETGSSPTSPTSWA